MRTRLLGGLEVDGLRPTEIGSRKARTLVKVLALGRGAPVPAGRVVEALWGDAPPARPLEQVGVLVSRLRGVLGAERLGRADAGWWLRTDWLDVAELDERVAEAQDRLDAGRPAAARAAARAALALVRGELLADEPDAAWAGADRLAVARQVTRARLLAARAALATGDAADAVAAAEAVLDADPYDEVALRLLLRAHVAAGRPGSALAAYERTRARLAEDLGADPDEETRQLHAAVLRGEVTGTVPAAAGPPFVGRSAQLAELDARLALVADGGAAGVEVVGEAGIGKTALVTRWAAAVARGAVVLVGRCDDPGVTLPLQPVLDALDAHLRDVGGTAAVAVLERDAAVLGPLLAAVPAGGPAPAAPLDPATGRALLFAALLRAVQRAGGSRPVVLVVDDAAHADPLTTAWLAFAVRRGSRLLVVTTRRGGDPGPGDIALGPLDPAETAALVGPDRAARLHARSGGNPLFLAALAAAGPAGPDDLPASVRASVEARAAALGPAAATLRAAAVLGREIDVDLLAAVLGLGVRDLLTHLEDGAAAQLVDDRGPVAVFAHELLREALADSVTAARRAFTHREAARVLGSRPGADPLAVARHARLGGDPARAAEALVAAAGLAVARHDLSGALAQCDEAVALADSPAARAARARVRLARLELDAAADDVAKALAGRDDPADLELAGWIAYYRRDHAAAARLAEEGEQRAGDPVLLASCRLLLGRIRHTRGDLAAADTLLTAAAADGPWRVRGTARVWLGALRTHQGRAQEALALVERAATDEQPHPFAAGHALWVAAHARGLGGDPVRALQVVDRFDALLAEQGQQGTRFVGVAANVRSWLLRGVGREDEAREHNAVAAALPPGPTLDEPRGVAGLDLADGRLAVGDAAGAAAELARVDWIAGWPGSMSWRHRMRHGLLAAQLALAAGDADAAAEGAAAVLADAAGRGVPRYRALAAVVLARAGAARGEPVDRDALDEVLATLDRLAGLEAWRVTADAAAALDEPRWWALADRRAAALVAAAGPDGQTLRRAVAARFAALGRR